MGQRTRRRRLRSTFGQPLAASLNSSTSNRSRFTMAQRRRRQRRAQICPLLAGEATEPRQDMEQRRQAPASEQTRAMPTRISWRDLLAQARRCLLVPALPLLPLLLPPLLWCRCATGTLSR